MGFLFLKNKQKPPNGLIKCSFVFAAPRSILMNFVAMPLPITIARLSHGQLSNYNAK